MVQKSKSNTQTSNVTPKAEWAISSLTDGQIAYEARRAAKAGVSLEKWLKEKQNKIDMQNKLERETQTANQKKRAPGLFARFLSYANKPFKSSE